MATASVNDLVPPTDPTANLPFLRRVRIQGYKSIAFCDVYLQPLTILVGRNSSGKSNFLDALAFLSDVVAKGADEAVRLHGGRHSILNRPGRRSTVSFEIESYCQDKYSRNLLIVKYKIKIKLPHQGKPTVVFERFSSTNNLGEEVDRLNSKGVRGNATKEVDDSKAHDWNSLGITKLSIDLSSPNFEFGRELQSAGFYNFSAEVIRALSEPSSGWMLERDGRNLASVIEDIRDIDSDAIDRVQGYLSAIVDEVEVFKTIHYGHYETIRFRLRSGGGKPLEFDATSMSDGTLRVLATLVAAFQAPWPGGPRVIGIEEPETALHPAAMQALVEALDEASYRRQILLTTHSAEMLTDRVLDFAQVLFVKKVDGQTKITPVDAASREIIDKELFSLADLQRQDLLKLNQADLRRQSRAQSGEGK